MNDKQETITDIVAEMRGLVKPGETLNHTYELLSGLADRLEAAVKRECIEVATRAATQGVNLTNEKYANTPIGNTVAMREALIKAQIALKVCDWPEGTDMDGVAKIMREIDAALAAPPRNCDMGTVEEQEDRFRRYCNSRGTFCGDCPLYKNRRGECRFAWAQMPYEEGGAK